MEANGKANKWQKVTGQLTSGAQYRPTFPASVVFRDKALTEISLRPSRPKPSHGSLGIPRQTLLSCFLQLPPELQLKILSYLDYGEIQRLRRTNRLFRRSINQTVVQSLFPRLLDDILCTCYICLTQKNANEIIRGDFAHPRFPLASRCFECAAKQSGFMVGKRYTMVNLESIWICRWCGYPVTEMTGWSQPEYHIICYQKYKGVLATHFGIGAMQWMIVIIGSALCWHYFKHEKMVVAPTAVNFVMSFWVCLLGLLRGPKMRTYHWSLLVELTILALWILPMHTIITKTIVKRQRSSLQVPSHITTMTLSLVALNM
ncbi:hypothetical protein V8C37DRAFT_71117 [Trichoderma ceciliae]